MPKSADIVNEVGEELPVRRVPPDDSDEAQSVTDRESPPAPDGEPAAADVETIARERDDYYDRLLRKTAEFDNYRKRMDRDRREQAEYAAADVLADLLPLVDDLERALETDAQANQDAYRQGVELIHKQMLDLLRRRGVTPIDAVGQPFDPRLHQAVTYEAAPGHADGEVVEELRRGYRLRDRLLRAAMVKVAKA